MKALLNTTCLIILIVCSTQGTTQVKVKLNNESGTLNKMIPSDFSDRTFIKGLSMFRNKIEDLAGSLIILNDGDKAEIIGQYLRSDQPPLKNVVLSDVLYSSKINNQFSANGSYMIGSTSANTNSIVELVVTDINGILIPEQSIPYLEICKAAKNVDKEVKKRIYYIRGVKVSSVHSKSYKEINSEAGISGVVFSAGGKVYSSSDQFKVDYVVSVDMVSLGSLLLTRNCDEIITDHELAMREKADMAKREAEAAETERKLRESELRSANVELARLRDEMKLLELAVARQTVDKRASDFKLDSLSAVIRTAESKAKSANDQLTTIEEKVSNLTALNSQKPIGDSPTQTALAMEIKEVRVLSEEEIQQLGFQIGDNQ